MIGQWLGRNSGTNPGFILLDIEEFGEALSVRLIMISFDFKLLRVAE